MNQDEAVAWLAEIFDEPVENLQPATLRDSILMWDSLGMLELMAGLDERFDITLDDDEMLAMKSVDDILAILRHHEKLDDSKLI